MEPVRNSASLTNFRSFRDFDICEFNDAKFAIFSNPIKSDKYKLDIDLDSYNIIFLNNIESERHIHISGITAVFFGKLMGQVEIEVCEQIVFLKPWGVDKNELIVKGSYLSQKHTLMIPIRTEQRNKILEKFKEGILNKDIPTVVDALMETYQVTKLQALIPEIDYCNIPNTSTSTSTSTQC